MAIFNYTSMEIASKIVFYGPGLSGKTTTLQYLHSRISSKGKLVSLATETDRTLFFDFFPVDFGQIAGFKVRFNFYTVPGQVFYNKTRKIVLKGADGVVFVADSQPQMMDQNRESLENLKENLREQGIDWETIPFVIQYNKRDVEGALSVDECRSALNPLGVPDFETVATTGAGVMEAMKAVCRLTLDDVQNKNRRKTPSRAPRAAPTRVPEPAPPNVLETIPVPGAAAEPQLRQGERSAVEVLPTSPTAGVGRLCTVPLRGAMTLRGALHVPLEVQADHGAESVEVSVVVRVQYADGTGQTRVGELTFEARPGKTERPGARGFWTRLFRLP